jgi:hypothetical protein
MKGYVPAVLTATGSLPCSLSSLDANAAAAARAMLIKISASKLAKNWLRDLLKARQMPVSSRNTDAAQITSALLDRSVIQDALCPAVLSSFATAPLAALESENGLMLLEARHSVQPVCSESGDSLSSADAVSAVETWQCSCTTFDDSSFLPNPEGPLPARGGDCL